MGVKGTVQAIYISFAAASVLEHDLFKRAACNADNCARAVTGAYRGSATLSAHLADCTSALACTVRPTTVYGFTLALTTNGVAPTSPTPVTNCPLPSSVPNYASACNAVSAYSSACSCAVPSASTTTLPAVTLSDQPAYTYITVTCTAPSPPVQTGGSQCGCSYETGCGFYDCTTRNFAGFFGSEEECRDFCDADPDCSGFVFDPGRAGQCLYCSNEGGVRSDDGERTFGYRVGCPADSGCNSYS